MTPGPLAIARRVSPDRGRREAPPPMPEMDEREKDAAFAGAQVSPWTMREKIGRALWMLVRGSLFRYSWHDWYGWRRWLLRLFGAKMGRRTMTRPTTMVEVPWLLEMGDYSSLGDGTISYTRAPATSGGGVTITQHAPLGAGPHVFSRWPIPLPPPPITVGDDAWIAADAFVAPGVN